MHNQVNTEKPEILQYIKNFGMTTLIYFKTDPSIVNNTGKKVYINTQTMETNRNTISLYILTFKTGLSKVRLNFLVIPNKIPNIHNINTVPQRYAMGKTFLQ